MWGARGFIGGALLAHLRDHGWRVRVLTRARTDDSPLNGAAGCVTLPDVDRHRAFDRALDGVDAVFNLAGSSGAVSSNRDPVESLESNCRLQLEFLDACGRAASAPHVVFASTRLVYGPSGRRPVDEHWPVEPRSMYAAHKLCVEHYHQIAQDVAVDRGVSHHHDQIVDTVPGLQRVIGGDADDSPAPSAAFPIPTARIAQQPTRATAS